MLRQAVAHLERVLKHKCHSRILRKPNESLQLIGDKHQEPGKQKWQSDHEMMGDVLWLRYTVVVAVLVSRTLCQYKILLCVWVSFILFFGSNPSICSLLAAKSGLQGRQTEQLSSGKVFLLILGDFRGIFLALGLPWGTLPCQTCLKHLHRSPDLMPQSPNSCFIFLFFPNIKKQQLYRHQLYQTY